MYNFVIKCLSSSKKHIIYIDQYVDKQSYIYELLALFISILHTPVDNSLNTCVKMSTFYPQIVDRSACVESYSHGKHNNNNRKIIGVQ